mmetsp:Transcript_15805/g.23950  ORF Transcript_15805/g.23950 Transcript_15805/m.23950 type:complete len:287 (+) Transcript_15805:313-1173(+)
MSSNRQQTTKTIVVEDFQNTQNKWTTLNDPVMGGQSYSNLTIENGVAKFTGKCAIVPSLQAPGFITMETGSGFLAKPSKFPDISSCTAFQFELKTNTEFKGYRFSFGKAKAKGGRFAYGYKTPLIFGEDLPPVGEYGLVEIPFDRFSDKWDDATGNIEVECKEDPTYCPTSKWLSKMETMSFWGEGVEGMVDLEVKSIKAVGCNMEASEISVGQSMIISNSHTIQSNPFYMAALILLAASGCIVCGCCFLLLRCLRSSNTDRKNKKIHYDSIDCATDDELDYEDLP